MQTYNTLNIFTCILSYAEVSSGFYCVLQGGTSLYANRLRQELYINENISELMCWYNTNNNIFVTTQQFYSKQSENSFVLTQTCCTTYNNPSWIRNVIFSREIPEMKPLYY